MHRRYNGLVTQEGIEEWTSHAFDGHLEVPVTAVYSRSDGIVGEGIARLPEHPLMQSIAVMASHVGFPFNPLVRLVLAERLAQVEGNWEPWQGRSLPPLVHLPD